MRPARQDPSFAADRPYSRRYVSAWTLFATLLIVSGPLLPASSADPVCELYPVPVLCGPLPIVADDTIPSGEQRDYNGPAYVMIGTVTVADGGTAVLGASDWFFTNDSAGFIIESGGRLEVRGARFQPLQAAHPGFFIRALAGSELVLTDDAFFNNTQVQIATDDATVDRATFHSTPLALKLTNASPTIKEVDIRYATTGVEQTGGTTVLDALTIEDTGTGIELYDAQATVKDSMMSRSMTGVYQSGGAGTYTQNSFLDRSDPWSSGVYLDGTGTAGIQGNSFTYWGSGIRVGPDMTVTNDVVVDNYFANNIENVHYD